MSALLTINNLPDELLELISISGGPTEYCNFRRAMRRAWLTTTGREDHCIKHFLVTEFDGYNTVTTLCGEHHSMFDLPAVTDTDGTKAWYRHGKLHRDNDLPAVIYYWGTRVWYQYGECHRDNDKPARIGGSSGNQTWYKHNIPYTP